MKNKTQNRETAETVIESPQHFFLIPWREILHYRDLLFLFVRRDFVSRYKQTILGPLWFIIQPLVTTLVFTIVFGRFTSISTGRVPQVLFYLSGLLAWDYFTLCLSGTAYCLTSNIHLFSKVYFPRLIVPISLTLSNLPRLGLQLVIFSGIYIYCVKLGVVPVSVRPTALIFLLPGLVFMTALAGLGPGLWVSAMTVKYRDLHHLIGFSIQLWMYATPVIYPLETVPDSWKWVLLLNPMTEILELYRQAFFGTGDVSSLGLALSGAVITVTFLSGLYMFNRVQSTFVDTI